MAVGDCALLGWLGICRSPPGPCRSRRNHRGAFEMTTPTTPAAVRVAFEHDAEPMGFDFFGVPVRDTAGFSFDTDPTRQVFDVSITIVRNELFFDLPKAIRFAMTVNDGPYTIPGFGTIGEEQGLCMPMRPLTEFTLKSTYVPVAYNIKARKIGWRTNIKNQGRNGWTAAGVTGKFVNTNAEDVDRPVLLDAVGLPMFPDKFKVKPNMGTASAAGPVSPPIPWQAGYRVERQGGFVLRFRQYEPVSFEPLLK